jgi:hypothetical protein
VLNDFLAGVLGTVRMRWVDAGHAALIAVALSLVIGVPPALAARRLSIVGALRGGV